MKDWYIWKKDWIMGRNNSNLLKARQLKNDEFYTRLEDIEKEVVHYKDRLQGKVIYCPCDDYRWSNFTRYFKEHFKDLGIKKLICTNYDLGDGAYRYEYDGEKETVTRLKGNGDFRSEECTKIKDMPDIVVVTNPPFSLFREFIDWLREDERFSGETSLW